MILVDTSVWIHFFNQADHSASEKLTDMISDHLPLCINSLIEMEIMQGIRKDKDCIQISEFLEPFLYFKELHPIHFKTATEIYRECRKRGITIRKSIDCLIAAQALVDGLSILHHDRDFSHIAKVFPKLHCIEAS